MELPSTTDIQLLLTQSPAGLNRTHVGLLKDLCTKNGLVVDATGRRNKSVKADYVAAILVYVSKGVEIQGQLTESCRDKRSCTPARKKHHRSVH